MVDRLFKKAGAGHGGHADVDDHPLAELKVGPPPELGQVQKVPDVDEDKVGPLGDVVLQADAVQPVQEVLPLFWLRLLFWF